MPQNDGSFAVIAALKNSSFDFFGSPDIEVESLGGLIFTALSAEMEDLSTSPMMPRPLLAAMHGANNLPSLIARVLASYLTSPSLEPPLGNNRPPALEALAQRFEEYLSSPTGLRSIVCDIAKQARVDPAITCLIQPCVLFKGFLAATAQRIAHHTCLSSRWPEALLIQSQVSTLWGLDLHPGAVIGPGVMFDHATGIVVGATAVIEGDAYILHGVTLGTSGKPTPPGAKRHPTVGRGVSLGAHATVLGDVRVGAGATVGAGAVVTRDMPDGVTVVGVNKILRAAPAGACLDATPIAFTAPRIVLAAPYKEDLSRARL
jgi:serine O-acetyltransferase